jgi:hypothetical protein
VERHGLRIHYSLHSCWRDLFFTAWAPRPSSPFSSARYIAVGDSLMVQMYVCSVGKKTVNIIAHIYNTFFARKINSTKYDQAIIVHIS